MPSECSIAEFVLPYGQHELKINYIGGKGQVIKSISKTITLTKSKTLNVVNSYAF